MVAAHRASLAKLGASVNRNRRPTQQMPSISRHRRAEFARDDVERLLHHLVADTYMTDTLPRAEDLTRHLTLQYLVLAFSQLRIREGCTRGELAAV